LFFSFKYLPNIKTYFLNLINIFNINTLKLLKNIKNKYLFNICLKNFSKTPGKLTPKYKKIKNILNHKKSTLLIHGILG